MKRHEIPENIVEKLRQANQNLVVASLRAQDLQHEAEASVERQTEFLSMLAHELRNPLAPIAMAAEMLEKIAAAHPQLPSIQQIIERQVGHMTRLLEDLLEASRVSSGKITLKKAPLLLTDMIQSAVELSQPSLAKHAQQLIVELPEHPFILNGDAVRLVQVVSNLLINASKYSAQHEPITLSAYQGTDGELTISVKDQGIGIEPEIQPYIFDLFMQAPRTLDRSEGGLGIGLSMVRALVQMHGGTVRVHSKGRGCGSEFIVLLPMSSDVMAPEALPVLPLHPARACRILIIEDNVDANKTLSFCLTFEGHTVASAFDGLTGLEMAKDGQYDVVICDLGLPGMDGYEVLKQIRLLRRVPAPCCIAVTGYNQQSYRARALDIGFDYYLVKPVSFKMLEDIISNIFPSAAVV